MSLFGFFSFDRALGVKVSFLEKGLQSGPPVFSVKHALPQHLEEGIDPETVQRRNPPGQLIPMAAELHDQRFVHIEHRITAGDPQPEVVVFTGRQPLIKTADLPP